MTRLIWNTPLVVVFILFSCRLSAQQKTAEDYGFRHLRMNYKGDSVDVLITSKKGDEEKKKPLFLFCQGSLPVPLIITYHENGKSGINHVFVFDTDSLSCEYHLAIIGKPGVPLIADEKTLGRDLSYHDSSGSFPREYNNRNLLDYYVNRNIAVIEYLQKEPWISKNGLVVAGHSEGSTIAAKLAADYPAVTHLIYSGDNPMGRIMTVIEHNRADETDSTKFAEKTINSWEQIVDDPHNMNASQGDTYSATYGFSVPPPIRYLEKLRIPVLVSYGTKDWGTPFNDYFRVQTIQQHKKNITFHAYIGTEHNYFPVKLNGEVNYDIFNWDKVASDWRKWLHEN